MLGKDRRITLVSIAFILFVIFLAGLFYLVNTNLDISTAGDAGGTIIFLLSFCAMVIIFANRIGGYPLFFEKAFKEKSLIENWTDKKYLRKYFSRYI